MGHLLPFIVSIPHGGLTVPPEVADRCALTDEEIFDESDAYSRELYGVSDIVLGEVTQEVARAIIDLNRSPEELPPEAKDGAVKELTRFDRSIWRADEMPDRDLQKTLLERHYHPYHQELGALLEAHRGEVRLLIDCHTMSSVGPPAAMDAGKPRPLICISNLGDQAGGILSGVQTSLPEPLILRLRDIMAEVFSPDPAAAGDEELIALNRPFVGGHITRHYSSKGFQVVQIELSKALYLDDRWFDAGEGAIDEGRLMEVNAKLRTTFTELASWIELS